MSNKMGMRIKEERKHLELTQEELGKKCGVTKFTISLYESGKSTPSDEIKKIMADLFEVSVDYLLGRTDSKGNVVREVTIDGRIAQIEMIKELMPENITDEELIGYVKMAIKLKNAGLKLDDK